jgi:hypothetical protein
LNAPRGGTRQFFVVWTCIWRAALILSQPQKGPEREGGCQAETTTSAVLLSSSWYLPPDREKHVVLLLGRQRLLGRGGGDGSLQVQ